jgi:Polyketide cyclase / dehydrase and lipid transport
MLRSHTPIWFIAAISLALAFGSSSAWAETTSVAANGFEVQQSIHVAASAEKAFASLITPAQWWGSNHTFSHDAANLTLDARAGGCWCESLAAGGSVEHMHVLYVQPGKILRMRGALGPFQSLAAEGVMTIVLKSAGNGTDITLTYVMGGFSKDGFEAGAKAADAVLAEQMQHLKKVIDG